MSDLIAIAYSDLPTAQRVASNVGELQRSHDIELDDLVIVERRDDGKIKLHQPSLAGVGAASGALWGGLIGLIFLVPQFMKELGDGLIPGSAAVVALVRKLPPDRLLEDVREQGTIIRTSLDDETEERLAGALAAAGH